MPKGKFIHNSYWKANYMTISKNKNSVVVITGSFILSEKYIRQLNCLGPTIL